MLSHHHFLKQIQATPDDPLPRLIYADWLEEQGHPGAELIRLEIARAKLPPWTEEYAALQHHWRPLWEQLDPEFLRPLGYQWLHRPLFTRLPESRADRWRLVDRFFENWFDGLQPSDNYTDADIDEAAERLGISIPAALREWFTRGGTAHRMCNQQNHLRPPAQWWLTDDGNSLCIAVESQAREYWGIALGDLHRDDPPVRRLLEPEIVCDSVSQFVLLWLLSAAKLTCGRQQGWLDHSQRGLPSELGRVCQRVDVAGSLWGGPAVAVYEGYDLIVESDSTQGYLWLAFRTAESVGQLPPALVDSIEQL